MRQSHDALRHGEFRPAGAFDAAQAIAFQRRSGSENLLVVMNRSEQEQTVAAELPEEDAAKFAKAHVIFSTNDGASVVPPNPGDRTLSVKLPPLTGAVIAP